MHHLQCSVRTGCPHCGWIMAQAMLVSGICILSRPFRTTRACSPKPKCVGASERARERGEDDRTHRPAEFMLRGPPDMGQAINHDQRNKGRSRCGKDQCSGRDCLPYLAVEKGLHIVMASAHQANIATSFFAHITQRDTNQTGEICHAAVLAVAVRCRVEATTAVRGGVGIPSASHR